MRPLHALVVADGDVPARDALDAAWPGWADGVDLVVAADGGALRAERLAFEPDIVVGDADSIAERELERLAERGARVERAPSDKDESDAELAVLAAVLAGAPRITVLGAFGGPRFDHALANVALLSHDALKDREVVMLDDHHRVSLIEASLDDRRARSVTGRIGDIVTLLPWGIDVDGVTTKGLRYALRDEALRPGPARGLSNVRTEETATIAIRAGRLLVVEVTGPGGPAPVEG